jgi:selenide, water dikinase
VCHPRYRLLSDRQTAGGLLDSNPANRADACFAALRRLGYEQATVIGRVLAKSEAPEPVVLILQ